MMLSKVQAVLGVRVYIDDELVAENVTFTPPAIGFASSEVQAMGALSLPVYQLPEAMEATIAFSGLDKGLVAAIAGGQRQVECRWAASEVSADGSGTRNVGYKAFLTCVPKSVPAIGVSVGEAGDNEVQFDVLRYELFCDGERALCIDKIAGVVELGGKDLTGDLQGLL